MRKLLTVLLCTTVFLAPSFAQTNYARMLSGVNAQTGTSYTIQAADVTKLVTFNNVAAVAVTLPAGSVTGFGVGTIFSLKALGAGSVTVTCACTIFSINGTGATTFVLAQGQGADLYSDGVNFVAQKGSGGSGASSPPATTFPPAVTSVNIYGDSIDLGYGLPAASLSTPSNQAWGALFAQMKGISVGTNYSIGGTGIADTSFIDSAYLQAPTAAVGHIFIPFSNDYGQYAGGDGATLTTELQAMVTWLALPASAKVLATSMTTVGSWGTFGFFGQTTEFTSTVNDTITGTVNGTVVYIGACGALAQGSMTVIIDGSTVGTIAMTTLGFGQGSGVAPLVFRFAGLASGNHTVQLKNISGHSIISWIAGNQGITQTPLVAVGGIIPRNAQVLATQAAQNARTSAMLTMLAGDGLNVIYVDDATGMSTTAVPSQYQPPCCVHPNAYGASLLASLWYQKFTPAQTFPAPSGVGGDALAQTLLPPALNAAMVGNLLVSLSNLLANNGQTSSYQPLDPSGAFVIPAGYESDIGVQQVIGANVTTTSTANPPTVALVTFSLPIPPAAGANRTYSWLCNLAYQSSVNTAGLAVGVNYSQPPLSISHRARIYTTKTGTSTDDSITTTTSGAVLTLAGANVAAGATTYEAQLRGSLEENYSAGSTFTLNIAATSAATITILRGSECRLWFH